MQPTLFLDLDGTIMRNPFWPAVFPLVSAHLAQRSGESATAITAMIVAESARRGASAAEAAVSTRWDDIVQTVAQRLGVACDLSVEQLVVEHSHPPNIAALDGAERILPAVRAAGWDIIAATHGLTIYQIPVLRALELLPLFSDIVAPDNRGCLKQERAFWLPYLDQRRPLVNVGDLYEDDVVPAKTFGMSVIWKTKPPANVAAESDPFVRARMVALPAGQIVRPDALIVHLSELPEALKTLLRASSSEYDRDVA